MVQQMSNGIGFIAGRWPLDPEESTIVFIHGAGGTSAFWEMQVEALADKVNTVAIDLPGHGRSHGNGHDSIEEFAQAVVNFIRNIEPPQPIPCGLSMGGAIVQQLLIDSPDFFKAGILICTGSKLRVAPEIFDAIDRDIESYLEMMLKLVVSRATDPDRIVTFKEDALRCKTEVLIKDFQACDRFDVMQRLGSITSPILVVTADEDRVTPPKYGEFLETSIAKASRSHIMEAGHIVPMEKPEEVNRAIIEFLDRTKL